MSFEVSRTPAEIASEVLLYRMEDPGYCMTFEVTRDQKIDLSWLQQTATMAGLFGGWLVEASLAIKTPRHFEADQETEYSRFNKLNFNGYFSCYSWLSIGEIATDNGIRTICMTFTAGTLSAPLFDKIDEQSMLHVPVMAVNGMVRSGTKFI